MKFTPELAATFRPFGRITPIVSACMSFERDLEQIDRCNIPDVTKSGMLLIYEEILTIPPKLEYAYYPKIALYKSLGGPRIF